MTTKDWNLTYSKRVEKAAISWFYLSVGVVYSFAMAFPGHEIAVRISEYNHPLGTLFVAMMFTIAIGIGLRAGTHLLSIGVNDGD